MKILEINNIRKSFGDLKVLDDISLSVEEGQVVSIIGPSGSGKSTLLRCATLLETMDGGSLSYLGKYACKDQDTCARCDGESVNDLGHSNQTYVLAEGGDGHTAEASGKGAYKSVAGQASSDLLIGGLAPKGGAGHCRGVTDGLGRRY